MINDIQVIAFDADDTLWINELYFREAEQKFCRHLELYYPHNIISKELFQTEMANLNLYGFGIKSFILSMIETATRIAGQENLSSIIEETIRIGKDLLQKPIELLYGVEPLLDALSGKYKLVLATKGDLLDQQRKLQKSKLEKFFHHIEIMSDKQEENYRKLISYLNIAPNHFLMVGDSLKSDIIPVLNIGGKAIHVPHHTNWDYETVNHKTDHYNFQTVENILQVLEFIKI